VSRERRESLSLKTATESLLRTVCGSEFQTAGAEHPKARFANVVVVVHSSQKINYCIFDFQHGVPISVLQ